MATETHAKSIHAPLTGTTADTVTITGYDVVDIINRSATEPLWVRYEGDASPTVAVAISVVGNGNAYSVVGVSA